SCGLAGGLHCRTRPAASPAEISPPGPTAERDCDETKETCVAKEQTTERSLAKRGRLLQHSLEHRLQLTRRAANNLEHIGGRRLLLKRFSQLVEQPRILYGDDGLGGEVLHQRDLLVGKRT